MGYNLAQIKGGYIWKSNLTKELDVSLQTQGFLLNVDKLPTFLP